MRLNAVDEGGQRGVVGRVARHHLIGQRETVGRDDQRDHHLDAVGTLVAAVAELAFARQGRVRLEIGAGQIVEQNIEPGLKQGALARLEEREELALVVEQPVETAVELVVGDHAVTAQQVT